MTAVSSPRRRPATLRPGLDLGIDLGTSSTLIYARGQGIVLAEPSVVAMDARRGSVLAVGHEARAMLGRTPEHITAVQPVRQGIVVDFDVTERMLRYFIRAVHGRRLRIRPRVVVCVPVGTTGIEQRAVEEAALQAGARSAHVMEEPMAAAIGVGLPVNEPAGNMVVDLGGGITEVAVVSLGGIVTSQSLRTGGDELDAAIMAHLKHEHILAVGSRTAEEVKRTIGSATPQPDERDVEIRGRDLATGLPRLAVVSSAEIRQAMREPLEDLVDTVMATLDRTPPELAADIMDKGIVLTGGGARLTGFDRLLAEATGMPVHLASDPEASVAVGASHYLEEVRGRLSA